MFFDIKLLVILIFIVISFLIIFLVQTRTTTVTSLIIAHLVLVLFLSLSIPNYNNFKEIVLALVAYSMVILFLISNYNPIFISDLAPHKTTRVWQNFTKIAIVAVSVMVIFFVLFVMVKNIMEISVAVRDKKFEKQNEVMANPMILPSHAVHIAVKKFYLGKKFANEELEEDGLVDQVQIAYEINQAKKARLKDKLSDNFLLKRSSDVILVIVAVATSMLLLARKKTVINS